MGLRGALGRNTPGPICTSRELSLTKPWFRYMAPTCVSGPRGFRHADGRGGSILSLLLAPRHDGDRRCGC
jgi:hypothetical protein